MLREEQKNTVNGRKKEGESFENMNSILSWHLINMAPSNSCEAKRTPSFGSLLWETPLELNRAPLFPFESSTGNRLWPKGGSRISGLQVP